MCERLKEKKMKKHQVIEAKLCWSIFWLHMQLQAQKNSLSG